MSYPIEALPDLTPLGGYWSTGTVRDGAFDRPVTVGIAHLPGVTWPYSPSSCEAGMFDTRWYLDGELLLCTGCGADAT